MILVAYIIILIIQKHNQYIRKLNWFRVNDFILIETWSHQPFESRAFRLTSWQTKKPDFYWSWNQFSFLELSSINS